MSTFSFSPRLREELVCSAPGGKLVLELPSGIPTAYLPTEEARCADDRTQFIIDPTALVS